MSDLPAIPNRPTAALGEVIGGYRIDRELGAGSTSRVFLGIHTRLGRKAAIKILSTQVVDDARVIKRLLAEAQIVNDIRHPNIVDISDFVESTSPKRVALVMEFVEGPSLKAFRGQPLPFPHAMAVALQLVAAVNAAHQAGVVHRDLKADNLLLTKDPRGTTALPRLKVVDFGIAKVAGPAMGTKPATSIMIGTPAYMAPEQIAGAPPPSAATDVYAIGEVIYELVTGNRVFDTGSAALTVQAKLHGKIPDLAIPPVEGGEAIRDLTLACLAQRPHERPSLDDVRRILLSVTPRSIRSRLGPEIVDEQEMFETLPPVADDADPMVETIGPGSIPIPASMTDPTQLVPMATDLAGPAAIIGSNPIVFDDTAASPIGAASDPAAFAKTSASPLGAAADPSAFGKTVASPARDHTDQRPTVPPDGALISTLNPDELPDTSPSTPSEEMVPTDPGEPWPAEDAKTTPISSVSLSSAAAVEMLTPAGWTGSANSLEPPRQRATWPIAAVAAALSALILGATSLYLSGRTGPGDEMKSKVRDVEPIEAAPKVVPTKARAVLLTSAPAGARVVDAATKEKLGVTPLAVMVEGASRRLRVSHGGHRSYELQLDGAEPRLHVELKKRRPVQEPPKTKKKKKTAPIAKDEFPSW